MSSGREWFSCPSCGKRFTYWVAEGNPHPKVKCSFCGKESFPGGEPEPASEAPKPAPAKPAPPAAPGAQGS